MTGGVSTNCGDQDFPGVYVRLDHPEVLNFIMKKRNEALFDQFGNTVKLGYNDYGYNEENVLIFLAPNGLFTTKTVTVIAMSRL